MRPATLSSSRSRDGPLAGMPAAASCCWSVCDVGVGDGVEHADAVEADAVLGQPGDAPHHGPDLLVGVGHRHDVRPDRRLDAVDLAGRHLDAGLAAGGEHGLVGVGRPGEADDDVPTARRGARPAGGRRGPA